MKHIYSRRWRTAALCLGAAICIAAGLWHGARRSAAQQPQQDRQVGLQNGGNNATPQRKVALVMGNGAYQSIGKLKNPVNDATDIATALQAVG